MTQHRLNQVRMYQALAEARKMNQLIHGAQKMMLTTMLKKPQTLELLFCTCYRYPGVGISKIRLLAAGHTQNP